MVRLCGHVLCSVAAFADDMTYGCEYSCTCALDMMIKILFFWVLLLSLVSFNYSSVPQQLLIILLQRCYTVRIRLKLFSAHSSSVFFFSFQLPHPVCGCLPPSSFDPTEDINLSKCITNIEYHSFLKKGSEMS